MKRVLLALALLLPTAAAAAPAEIHVLLDTSASMGEPLAPGSEETRLDRARAIVSAIARAAGPKHRVGLLRYAQLETLVDGGEGPRTAHEEDPEQCAHRANLLATPSLDGGRGVLRWVDGVEEPTNPEVVALGDSPLEGALRAVTEYVRLRRLASPFVACVNTYIVVLTDGFDSCTPGGELHASLARLARTAAREDLHVIPVSFDAGATIPAELARIGWSEAEARVWSPEEGDALAAYLAGLVGRPAPEACAVSGVPPQQVGLPPEWTPEPDPEDPAPTPEPECRPAKGARGRTEGCSAGAGAAAAWVLVLAVLLIPRRKPVALLAAAVVVAALAGCGDDPAPARGGRVCDGGSGGSAGSGGEPQGHIPEPQDVADADLERIDALLETAAAVQERLAPSVEPAAAFAALPGDPVPACLQLARSIPYERYRGAQRGVAGCLLTGRCNTVDHALLLQACLASKGVSGELVSCSRRAADTEAVLQASALPAWQPDTAWVQDELDEAVADELDPDASAAIAEKAPLAAAHLAGHVAWSVEQSYEKLAPLLTTDPARAKDLADGRLRDEGFDLFHQVRVDGAALNPVYDDAGVNAPSCSPADAARFTRTLEITVEIAYARWDAAARRVRVSPAVPAATLEVAMHEVAGRGVSLAIADAASQAMPEGLPPPATTGCLRTFLRAGDTKVRGEPFFIGAGDACEGAIVEGGEGEHLARIALRFEGTGPGGRVLKRRLLLDRYGYAYAEADRAAGPMYSDLATRDLAPMRVELPVLPGLPTDAALLHAFFGDLLARRPEVEARAAIAAGLPMSVGVQVAPWPLAMAVLGQLRADVPGILPDHGELVVERPFLFETIYRRGYGMAHGGFGVGPQVIFDVLDAPFVVHAADADARLEAQVKLGIAVTEAERAVTTAYLETEDVVNAAAMLRDADTGPWGVIGTAGFETSKYPASMQADLFEAGRPIATQGAAPYLDSAYVAWFREDPDLGGVLGEVRLDGSFFGGAGAADVANLFLSSVGGAGVQFIADADRCLFAVAIVALNGGEASPVCCLAKAMFDFLKNSLSNLYKASFFEAAKHVNLSNFAMGVLGKGEKFASYVDAFDKMINLLESMYSSSTPPEAC